MGRVIIATLLWMVVSFFVGGIPFGLLIAKTQGVDVRKTGSGNIGTTNVARSVGAWASGLTLLLDATKGAFCTALAPWVISSFAKDYFTSLGVTNPIDVHSPFGCCISFVFLAAILGHVFSPYLGFHGGKGIACGLGCALGISVPYGLCLLAGFIAVAVPTKYVSAGSCFAAASVLVWSLIFGFSWQTILPLLLVSAVVLWAHRSNIGRLMRGEEKKFTFKKSDSK